MRLKRFDYMDISRQLQRNVDEDITTRVLIAKARYSLRRGIDAHAERAQAEIKLLTALAMRRVRRMAEFPARSAGKKRRHLKEKAK